MHTVEVPQRCINVNDDVKRFQYMTISHSIEGVLFLIRFIIICTDLSAASDTSIRDQSSLNAFLAFIFLFEFIGGLLLLLINLLYACLTYTGRVLYETDRDEIPYCPRKPLLRLSTLTCFTCDCYYEHPHAVLLTRVAILSGCFLLRFIAFILGATCASRYPPRAIAYTVFAALSIVPAVITIIFEYAHHRRLWHYFPDGNPMGQRASQHIQFLPYSIINDQRTNSWRASLCKRGPTCPSRNLYHILLYHSGSTQYSQPDKEIIGFHQTDQTAAFGISREGFKRSERGMLGPGVYFATCIDHTEFKANHRGAYICARVRLGQVTETTDRDGSRNATLPGDTIYYKHIRGYDEFCVREPSQVLQWIIVINQDDSVRRGGATVRDSLQDRFHGTKYEGCIF